MVKSVQKARKSPGDCGRCGHTIKAGESYWWWQHKYSPKSLRCSKCPPKASETTSSEFWQRVYSLQEQVLPNTKKKLIEEVENIKSELEEIRDDCQGKLDNMPEGLQQGPVGETLQMRVDSMENAISDLDGIDESNSVDDIKSTIEDALTNIDGG